MGKKGPPGKSRRGSYLKESKGIPSVRLQLAARKIQNARKLEKAARREGIL